MTAQSVASVAGEAFGREVKFEVVVAVTEAADVLQFVDFSVRKLDLVELLFGVVWVQPSICGIGTVAWRCLGLSPVERVLECITSRRVGKSRGGESECDRESGHDAYGVHFEGSQYNSTEVSMTEVVLECDSAVAVSDPKDITNSYSVVPSLT